MAKLACLGLSGAVSNLFNCPIISVICVPASCLSPGLPQYFFLEVVARASFYKVPHVAELAVSDMRLIYMRYCTTMTNISHAAAA